MVNSSALEVVAVDGIFFEVAVFLIVDVDKVVAVTVVNSGICQRVL